MLLLGWGPHKSKPPSCPLSCWQFSLDSCTGRWSGPQKGEEGRDSERGREKGFSWEPLVLVSTSWLSNNHVSQTCCMNWSEWSDPIPLLHLSHYLMHFFMCLLVFFLTEMHSPNIFILTNLPALLWIFPSTVLWCSSHDWVIRVAHSVLEKRVTVIYIRALQYLW